MWVLASGQALDLGLRYGFRYYVQLAAVEEGGHFGGVQSSSNYVFLHASTLHHSTAQCQHAEHQQPGKGLQRTSLPSSRM